MPPVQSEYVLKANFVPPINRFKPQGSVKLCFTGSSYTWECSGSPVHLENIPAEKSAEEVGKAGKPPDKTTAESRPVYGDDEDNGGVMPSHNIDNIQELSFKPMAKSQTKTISPQKRKPQDVNTSGEVVVVDDDDETPPPTKKTTGRKTRAATALVDTDKLCEFPHPVTSNSVSVSLQDYKTLEHDTFINDIIIDFYLTYLFFTILTPDDRPTVHLFSTMFYKRLNSTPKKNSALARHERDSNLGPSAKRHMRVKGWTKSVDLFEKNMLIIPICEHSHWYLVVVVRPGLIMLPLGSEERVTKGEPFFIVLDSMGGNKNAAVSNVRNYLAEEWMAKRAGEEEEGPLFSSKEMRVLRPQKPEQENYSDCGVYLLHYVEKIFGSVAQYYWPNTMPDLSSWFTVEEVGQKRGQIAELIRTLASDQWVQGREVRWPEIKFSVALKRARRGERIGVLEDDDAEDDMSENVLGEGGGLAASGFYGERGGEKARWLRSREERYSGGQSSGVSSSSAGTEIISETERAREVRHRRREEMGIRLKPGTQQSSSTEGRLESSTPSTSSDGGGTSDVTEKRKKFRLKSAAQHSSKAEGRLKSSTPSTSSDVGVTSDVTESRKKLQEKLDKIKASKSAFDELRSYRIPRHEQAKTAASTYKLPSNTRESRVPPIDSVTEVESGLQSEEKHFTTKVVPSERTKSSVNSIANSLELKARADLHKIAEELDNEEDGSEEVSKEKSSRNKTIIGRRRNNSALNAFKSSVNGDKTSSAKSTDKQSSTSTKIYAEIKTLKDSAIVVEKVIPRPETSEQALQSKVVEILQEMEEEDITNARDVENAMGKSKLEKQVSEDLKILELVESEEFVTENKKTADLKPVKSNPTLVLVESNPTSPDTVVTLANSPDTVLVDDCHIDTDVLVEDGNMDSGDIVDIEDTEEDNFALTGFLEKVTVPKKEVDAIPPLSKSNKEKKRDYAPSTSEPNNIELLEKVTNVQKVGKESSTNESDWKSKVNGEGPSTSELIVLKKKRQLPPKIQILSDTESSSDDDKSEVLKKSEKTKKRLNLMWGKSAATNSPPRVTDKSQMPIKHRDKADRNQLSHDNPFFRDQQKSTTSLIDLSENPSPAENEEFPLDLPRAGEGPQSQREVAKGGQGSATTSTEDCTISRSALRDHQVATGHSGGNGGSGLDDGTCWTNGRPGPMGASVAGRSTNQKPGQVCQPAVSTAGRDTTVQRGGATSDAVDEAMLRKTRGGRLREKSLVLEPMLNDNLSGVESVQDPKSKRIRKPIDRLVVGDPKHFGKKPKRLGGGRS